MVDEISNPSSLAAERKKNFGKTIYGVADILNNLLYTAPPSEENMAVNTSNRGAQQVGQPNAANQQMSQQKVYSIEDLMLRSFFQTNRLAAGGGGGGGLLDVLFDENGFVADGGRFGPGSAAGIRNIR